MRERSTLTAVPIIDIHFARQRCELGDLDGAIERSRAVLDDLLSSGRITWSVLATTWWSRC